MALTIAVATTKGGAGKTTTAILLAGALSHLGLTVTILDTDPQASALQWYQRSRANQATSLDRISVEALPGDETELAARLNRDTGAEITIIDVQGSANQVLAVAAAYADLVVIPVQGSLLDATQALKVVDFLKAIAGRRPMTPYRILLNRVSGIEAKTRAFVEAVHFLVERNLDLANTYIRDRPLYRHITNGHGTLYDLDENASVQAARTNAADLAEELLSIIQEHRKAAE